MDPDFNRKTDSCLNDVINSPISTEPSPTAIIMKQLKQEFSKLPIEIKIMIMNEIDCNSSQDEDPFTRVFIGTKGKRKKEKKLIFGCCKSVEILTILLLKLDKEIQLFFDRSQVHVFVNMLVSKDLSQFHEQLHLKCLTTEFKCIMEHLSLYCKSFNPTTIEKSNAFISSNGTLLNASYLYNTSTEHLHNKDLIADIFKKYC